MKRLSDLQLFEEREGEGRAAQRGDHIIYYLQSLFEQRREGEEAGGADHASAEGSALSRRLSEGFHPPPSSPSGQRRPGVYSR